MESWGEFAYEYLKSHLYNERVVVVLPYRKYIEGNSDRYEFLAVLEESHINNDNVNLNPIVSVINEDDESPVFTAMRGLYNETGYKASDKDLISLGEFKVANSLFSTVLLYSVNLEGKVKHPLVKTDELRIEKDVVYDWFKTTDIIGMEDAMLNALILRLWESLNGKQDDRLPTM